MEFNKAYNRQEFVNFLQSSFLPNDFLPTAEAVAFAPMKYTSEVVKLGSSQTLDLVVYEIKHTSKHDARVALSKEAFRLLNEEMEDRALVVFIPEDCNDNYRLSFIEVTLDIVGEGNHRVSKGYSNPRRYSYFLGKGIAYYTPNKYLNEKGRVVDDEDLHSRFSVEVLTKEFYNELSDWYAWAIQIIRFPNDINDDTDDAKYNNESAIRLITRLIFVWFLKQRHLIPDEFFDEKFIADNLIEGFNPHVKVDLFYKSKESKYYKAILQNLFFAMLNSPITAEGSDKLSERHFRNGRGDYDNNKLMRYEDYFSNPQLFVNLANQTVPFLNGGLFDCLDDKDNGMYYDGFSDRESIRNSLILPDYLFFGEEVGKNIDLSEWYCDKNKKKVSARGIIDILKRYNFTVEENTPFDQEVSLDPELLGKVFENLLASFNPETQTTARKQTGSFYTPREIVQYMVDESLVAHLKRTVGEELEPKFRELLQYTDEPIDFTDEQRKSIMQSLYNCKILDPACGSGAFPMGMLQQMVHILGRIDPDNEQWKEMMMNQAIDETSEAYRNASKEERSELIADIERSFDESVNRPDYARKLYLIENCIYGVDIQPIAIQISKLRFFISLVVDQNTNSNSADNFGIRPLPNLEAKFVAANTLIGLKSELNLADNAESIRELKNQLKTANHKIFSAKTVKTKRKYKQKVCELRQAIATELKEMGFIDESETKQLASWNMFDQNTSSPFFDPEWMFDIKEGFDIVIGNPPYGAKLSDSEKEQYRIIYNNKSSETAILFIECAINLLGTDGVQSFIIPKAFTYSSKYESIREYIRPWMTILVDCGKAFEQVKLEACIEVIEKQDIKSSYKNVNFDDNQFHIIGFVGKSTKDVFGFYLNGVSSECITIALKMKQAQTTLGDISINDRGDTLQKFISETGNIPIIGGKDIDRYSIRSYKGYIYDDIIINTKAKIRPNSLLFQNIVAHIANPYPHIKLTGCIPQNTNGLITDTINQIVINNQYSNKYIWALLNSKLICWYVYLFIYGKAIRTMHFDSVSTNRIPIARPTTRYINSIENIVSIILNKKGYNRFNDTSVEENEIDRLVYELYGLTYGEILIVDPNTPITKEEYEA